MAVRIAPRCRVKAAWELPYIYISICLENNNPRGGRGEALAELVQGGFGGAGMGGPPQIRANPQDLKEIFFFFFAKQLKPAGFSPCGCTAAMLIFSFLFPGMLQPRGWTGGGRWGGTGR